MRELEMKRLIAISKGERKIRDRNIIGEPNDMAGVHRGSRTPLVAIMNSQKNATMVPIEPTNNPNAKGSLHPPLTAIVENIPLGVKFTDLIVPFMPPHNPTCKRLSHSVGCLSLLF